MSAWRIGAESASAARRTAEPESFGADAAAAETAAVSSTLDRLTKWIPGDALALYVAAVTAFAAADHARPSVVLLIVFIVLAAAFVVGAAFADSGEIPRTTVLPAILAAVALTIWSLSVPFSGWHRWDVVADNQAAVAIVAALAGALFGLVAEGLTKRAAKKAAPGGR